MILRHYSIGFNYKINVQKKNPENIISIFPANSIFYLIAWDKIKELEQETNKYTFDINEKTREGYSLIDIAAKYGSEKCFFHLLLNGCQITAKTSISAIEGGNKNIIMHLYNEGMAITDDHLIAAMKYYHNKIFDWLLNERGSIGKIIPADFFYYGNFKAYIFLVENGNDPNGSYARYYDFLCIIIIWNFSYLYEVHYNLKMFIILIYSSHK